ncbi:hypothetical protein DPMN_167277 [Dreissena polymorpha]|uniref:Uncharacterized protein n=1 Tax=Dreissena polymorpha TaxID=45954 RepID=A0A9D4IYM7_DREPO|nr:hypothetical protein DPMN_167277 [Dreissena polymorpha]
MRRVGRRASYPTLLKPYCYRNAKQNNNRHQLGEGGPPAGGRKTPNGESQCQLEAISPKTIIYHHRYMECPNHV